MAQKTGYVKKVVKKLVDGLKSRDIKVNTLILYGSYARGTQRTDSDIDIAVISSSFDRKNILQRQEVLGEIIYPLKEPIEALGYSWREFKHRHPLSFLSEILATGKIVYRE